MHNKLRNTPSVLPRSHIYIDANKTEEVDQVALMSFTYTVSRRVRYVNFVRGSVITL